MNRTLWLMTGLTVLSASAWAVVSTVDGAYGVRFDDYDAKTQEALSDKGAWGGTWGRQPVPDEATACAAVLNGEKYMYCSSTNEGIAFVPADTRDGLRKEVEFALMSCAGQVLPDAKGTRTAISVFLGADQNGAAVTNLVAWVDPEWKALQLPSGVALPATASDPWYRMKAIFRTDGKDVYVQYRLMVTVEKTARYVALTPEGSDSSWIFAGEKTGPVLRRIEFRGEGGLGYVYGGEAIRGLVAGLGAHHAVVFDENVSRHDTGTWNAVPQIPEGESYFSIGVDTAAGENPSVFRPSSPRSDVEVIEAAVRFTSTNDDDTVPTDACARIRIVEDADFPSTQPDVNYRFCCLVGDRWVTNGTVNASLETDYTVEVTLDDAFVKYRAKKGIGYGGSDYVELCRGALSKAGKYADVSFEGYGRVYRIKGTDR